MSEIAEGNKLMLYLLGGAICTLIYKINKHSYQQQQSEMSRIYNKRVLSFSELRQLMKLTDEPIDVVVQGDIRKVDKLKKSSDKRYKVVYSQRKKDKIEYFQTKSVKTTIKTPLGSTVKAVDRFQIIDGQGSSSIQIADFKQTRILDGVIKYIKYDKINRNPEVREIIRQPANDIEQAQFNEDKSAFTTTVLSMGIAISESCLVEGTTITVYGSAVFNKNLNLIEMINPQFFAKHKAEIVNFLQGEIYWKQFLGVLYLFGGFVFLIFFLRSLKRLLTQDERNQTKTSQK